MIPSILIIFLEDFQHDAKVSLAIAFGQELDTIVFFMLTMLMIMSLDAQIPVDVC
jgi:hypothetical protein